MNLTSQNRIVDFRVRCPAKINLFLSVGPRDDRGYHPIRTIFQAIELSDTLIVQPGEGRHRVICDDPTVPRDNSVTKALRLLAEVIELPPLHVSIHKRIPSESGLGGGSSDAAGILRVAQAIAGVTIPSGELRGIAEAVGMDVPFFLVGGRARGVGYGEILTPAEDPATCWIVVARPGVGCSTVAAYRRLDERTYSWREFPETDVLYNDFERVAPTESLDLMHGLEAAGAKDAALSGSGSAVFGRFPTREAAEAAAQTLREDNLTSVWVTRSLSRAESLAIQEVIPNA